MTNKKAEFAALIKHAAHELAHRSDVIAKSPDSDGELAEFFLAMLKDSRQAICFWTEELEKEVCRDGETQ